MGRSFFPSNDQVLESVLNIIPQAFAQRLCSQPQTEARQSYMLANSFSRAKIKLVQGAKREGTAESEATQHDPALRSHRKTEPNNDYSLSLVCL